MLLIENLKVELGDKILLDHIDLEISPGETHILFGPNGSGKTSLLMTIMGYPQYKVVGGKMTFKGVDITYLPINERAKLGHRHILSAPADHSRFENPADGEDLRKGRGRCRGPCEESELSKISGPRRERRLLRRRNQAVRIASAHGPEARPHAFRRTRIRGGHGKHPSRGQDHRRSCFRKTPISGGEAKSKMQKKRERTKMGLIITHTGYILDYVAADKGQVLFDGRLSCVSNPREILNCIGQNPDTRSVCDAWRREAKRESGEGGGQESRLGQRHRSLTGFDDSFGSPRLHGG